MFDNVDLGATLLTLIIAFLGSGIISTLISKSQEKEITILKSKLESNTFITNKQYENEIGYIQDIWNKYCIIHGKFDSITSSAINIQTNKTLKVERSKIDEYTNLILGICDDIYQAQPFLEKEIYKSFFDLINLHRSYIYGLNLTFFHDFEKDFNSSEGYVYAEMFNQILKSRNEMANNLNVYLSSKAN